MLYANIGNVSCMITIELGIMFGQILLGTIIKT